MHGIPVRNFEQNIVDKDTPVLLLDLIISAQNSLQRILLLSGPLQNALKLAQCLDVFPQRSHIHPLLRQHEFVDKLFHIVHRLKSQRLGNNIKELVVQISQTSFEPVLGSVLLVDIRNLPVLSPKFVRQGSAALHHKRKLLQSALLQIPPGHDRTLLVPGKHMYAQYKVAVPLLLIKFQCHIGRHRIFPKICLSYVPDLTADIPS